SPSLSERACSAGERNVTTCWCLAPGRVLNRRARGEALAVLLLVVLLVLARLDRLPPGAVLAVPVDGRADAVVEVHLRLPAERVQLRRVDRVAPVVAGPVVDAAQQRPIGARQLEQ